MATKKIASSQNIYQIKVTLLGTKPPIWRRLLVPASMTLTKLHDVLQTAMGWAGGHMHEFRTADRHFGIPDPEDRIMGMQVEYERSIRLSSVLRSAGANLYTPTISATTGNTPSSWRNCFPLNSISISSSQSALTESLRARRTTAEASPDTTNLSRPSLTLNMIGTKKSANG